jgi:hypothetical protein
MPHLSGGLRNWSSRIARDAEVLIVVQWLAVLCTRIFCWHATGEPIRCRANSSTLAATECISTARGRGSPPVILDSGQGDSYISWRKVQTGDRSLRRPSIAGIFACRQKRPSPPLLLQLLRGLSVLRQPTLESRFFGKWA